MSRVTSKDGTSIAYERQGTGPAIILVTGALDDGPERAPLAAELAQRFTVYNDARRGRGDSGDTFPYEGRRGNAVELFAAFLAARALCADPQRLDVELDAKLLRLRPGLSVADIARETGMDEEFLTAQRATNELMVFIGSHHQGRVASISLLCSLDGTNECGQGVL